ncbi:putative stearoyl-CoA desaturase 5 [Apostichopus japonicus]|uniref:Putative stearoyl-CoA desaturase 5 n=1 Tax=Stichopus japonicus TaxID=307972 RepID=A0A2G8KCX5_STIJA|nr:putative stearoyl-CoA desaturase 5 [Apostichopus japonicus]
MTDIHRTSNGTSSKSTSKAAKDESLEYKMEIVWGNVLAHCVLHAIALYGLTDVAWKSNVKTLLFATVLVFVGVMGVTAGPHRLWCHRGYSAKLPMRILLAVCSTLAFQNSIFTWARDHRAHHKFTDTNADPHNAKRGFFFSHIGWLMVKKHPDVIKRGGGIDCSDLLNDPVVYYQHKYYYQLSLIITFFLPTYLPHYLWGESIWNAFIMAGITRLILEYHIAWSVNSVAHMWGNRPYDESIDPAENMMVSLFGMGEGWHNYHHVFPFDYRASEFSWKLNPTTQFIDLMHLLGQAYNLKTVPKDLIKARAQKTGNGTMYEQLNRQKVGQVDAENEKGYTYDY